VPRVIASLLLWFPPNRRATLNQYYQDLLVDALLDSGFTLEEALRLIALHERIERDRREEQMRRQLLSWLDTWDERSLLN
jgi:hypothetical protein